MTSADDAPKPAPAPEPDLDLDLVADDLAGVLDPVRADALHQRIAADPAAAGRYAEFARTLETVTALLAAEPVPPVPDDVVRRLDAAFTREVDSAAAHARALARVGRDPRRSLRWRVLGGRSFGAWGAGLIGAAAIAGVVVVAVHGAGGSSGSSSSAASPDKVRSGSGAGLAGAPAVDPTAAPAAGGGSTTAGPSGTLPAEPLSSPAAAADSVVVTAANLSSVARTVYPVRGFTGSVPAGRAGGPTPAVAHAGADGGVPATCRPAGVTASVPLLAAEPVRFAGRPALLLVLAGPTDRPGAVRATVIAACGDPALLSRVSAP